MAKRKSGMQNYGEYGNVMILEPEEEDSTEVQMGRGYTGTGGQDFLTGNDAMTGSDGGFREQGSIDHVQKEGEVFDLTSLSGNMLFAEVFNMLCAPGEYMGETIRMKGTMFIEKNQSTGMTYYGCFMKDAMGCCSQGFEFELTCRLLCVPFALMSPVLLTSRRLCVPTAAKIGLWDTKKRIIERIPCPRCYFVQQVGHVFT